MLNIDNKITNMALQTAVAQAKGKVCWHNQNNVNNNKMMFSADDRVLIQLLKQKRVWC